MQLVLHAVAPQMYGVHAWVAGLGTAHLPVPLQVAAKVSLADVQLADTQAVVLEA